ncbi:hypothetical protein ACO0QE_001430 [Hanseniaspora vineae]
MDESVLITDERSVKTPRNVKKETSSRKIGEHKLGNLDQNNEASLIEIVSKKQIPDSGCVNDAEQPTIPQDTKEPVHKKMRFETPKQEVKDEQLPTFKISPLKVSPTKIISKQDLINSPSKKSQAVRYYRSLTTQEDATDEEEEDSEDNGQAEKEALSSDDNQNSFDPFVPQDIIDEMQDLLHDFPGLKSKYQLLDKIGEGTFSSVYKAKDKTNCLNATKASLKNHFWAGSITGSAKKPTTYVALKRIYVTSSPQRIYNELKLLYILSKSPRIAPLYDALRYQDQIIAVLPYYAHEDFRVFYRVLPIKGIKKYMFEMFEALAYIHERGVMHRDIKPTNFLYNTKLGKGVLVDFGLAELESSSDFSVSEGSIDKCPCVNYKDEASGSGSKSSGLDGRKSKSDLKDADSSVKENLSNTSNIFANSNAIDLTRGYPKHESRRSRRANRAGTRGFRAPEVLLKCSRQTVKIDMWSCGVILLCFLARRFPMFQSLDDVESLMELSVIFGIKQLNKCCNLHGLGCNISTNLLQGISEEGFKNGLKGYVKKLLQDENKMGTLPAYSPAWDTLSYLDGKLLKEPELEQQSASSSNHNSPGELKNEALERYKKSLFEDHKNCFEVLHMCLTWNYHKRPHSKEILKCKWFDELTDEHEL